MLLLFSQTKTKLLLCLKILLDIRTLSRDGYRILSSTKTVLFGTKVNRWKVLTVFSTIFILDVSGV